MKKILYLLILVCSFVYSQNATINTINKQIEELNSLINKNVWNIHYENFNKYQEINNELIVLDSLLKKDDLKLEQKEEIKKKIVSLKEQLNLLKDYKDFNFAKILLVPQNIEILPKLTNPLEIINAFSHIKKLKNEKEEYIFKFNNFKNLIDTIKEKNTDLKELVKFNNSKENIKELEKSNKKLEEFEQALQFVSVSFLVYEKKIDEEIFRVQSEIKEQSLKALNLIIAIIIVIVISFLLKMIVKKYIKDNERYYTATKIINVINVNIILFILLFVYIENISYLITILGFASAGLAIAMKDMFMSMLGWCVIIFGGSFRVGDRIRVTYNNEIYVGDIIDISLLKITLYEDITLVTYTDNRRAGRIIFIPNNYVFTELISNYTHHGMKTIFDGIDITLSFDSNLEKAQKIIEEIVIKHSKPYTNLAKKTLTKLQNTYSIKNPQVGPKFFTFFENYGMRISAWYMTNSYAALTLRSTLCKEIVKEFNKHKDIKFTYPTQNIYFPSKEDILKHSKENF
ncbi:mechanosensitive ion channel domain-containing protein [Campylobacter sp. TTU_617]|uniref:mechanosensitive ion channel domain-containing protein n=1 Tax=Campylobacter sp. TTU_617 TaxID=2768148 RepID=UPI0019036F94|nr:mechanosensitive ion channel domain-containing protein [Campylobacter sp. TTU_617]MBK1971015.1 mechanosensitive ion channel [Campylobacter sp. TTU_617]